LLTIHLQWLVSRHLVPDDLGEISAVDDLTAVPAGVEMLALIGDRDWRLDVC
jgi:hypothetical protein